MADLQGIRPNGIHHLAISTANMKEQLTFFTDVLGMELVALFWMHGVKGAWHSFLKFDDDCFLSFVHIPKMTEITAAVGHTHPGHPGGVSAGGTMQHLSIRVRDQAAVLAMRDRVRSRGIPVLGELDHGMCLSIYFAGPEGLVLEIACHGYMEPGAWLDPEVVKLAGISQEELARMVTPADFLPGDRPVSQPVPEGTPYNLRFPPGIYERLLAQSDAEMKASASVSDSPRQMIERARELDTTDRT